MNDAEKPTQQDVTLDMDWVALILEPGKPLAEIEAENQEAKKRADEEAARAQQDAMTAGLDPTQHSDAAICGLYEKLAKMQRERDHYKNACTRMEHEIQQTLAGALGFPRYVDDQATFPGATEASGYCAGPYTSGDLATLAADKISAAAKREKILKLALEMIVAQCVVAGGEEDDPYALIRRTAQTALDEVNRG